MANKSATGKKAKHGTELAQRTRSAVLNTFDAIEKNGKKISDILAQEFEKNPIKFMELASKLIPKEVSGEIEHIHTAKSLTDDQLANIAAGGSADTADEAESPTAIH